MVLHCFFEMQYSCVSCVARADPCPRNELEAFCLVLHAHLVNCGFACLRRGANNDADGFLAHPSLPDQWCPAIPSSTLHLTYCHIDLQARSPLAHSEDRKQETVIASAASTFLSHAAVSIDLLPRFEVKLTSLFDECVVRRHALLTAPRHWI